jgi:hypothetical protein
MSRLEEQAYVKLMLHATQHAASPVFGVLLGKIESGKFILSEAVPVCHDFVLASLVETALLQISFLPTIRKSETLILGVYFANKAVSDNSLPASIRSVAESIHATRNITPVILQARYSFLSIACSLCADALLLFADCERRACQSSQVKRHSHCWR